MDKDYGSWSLTDLKSELKKRNAKTIGKKAVLVQRLEDYDKLFGPLVTDPESAYKIVTPSPDLFKDVTSDAVLPNLTVEDMNLFCQLIEREDKTTSFNMYTEMFLISCRSAIMNGDFYITGVCASEMRKNVIYNVTIRAKNNLILEAQCECAAGAGPFGQCKHILVLMHGIIDFISTKNVKLRSSCTSTLQTFHQPRNIYTGNPMEAKDLTLKFKDKKLKEAINFDPRKTIGDENKGREEFLNLVANFCGQHGSIPLGQMIKPANKESVYSDHDYLKETAEETFLNSLILSDNEIKKLQEITKDDKKEWLRLRKFRLQSSDFGKICKTKGNHIKLARDLMKNKNINTPAIKHGKKYECDAKNKYEQVTGATITKCGIIINTQYQFLGSTPDGLLEDKGVLEIKCPYAARQKEISPETIPYIYLCEESGEFKLDKKHDYFYQIQGQMLCTNRKEATLFIYTLCDYKIINVERDEVFINKMLENLGDFYNMYYKNVLIQKFLYNKKF